MRHAIPACCMLLRFVEILADFGPQVSCPVCLQVWKYRGISANPWP
jgi:hypothetical protein